MIQWMLLGPREGIICLLTSRAQGGTRLPGKKWTDDGSRQWYPSNRKEFHAPVSPKNIKIIAGASWKNRKRSRGPVSSHRDRSKGYTLEVPEVNRWPRFRWVQGHCARFGWTGGSRGKNPLSRTLTLEDTSRGEKAHSLAGKHGQHKAAL